MNYKQLKLFAIGSMVFDHVVRIFPLYYMLLPLALPFWDAGQDDVAVWLTEDLRHYLMYIGRLAAPIFIYCVTKGFAHTSNIRRYIGRILCTAVIAQIPYTLFSGGPGLRRRPGLEGGRAEHPLHAGPGPVGPLGP